MIFKVKDLSKGRTVAMQIKWLYTVDSTSLSVDSTGYYWSRSIFEVFIIFLDLPQKYAVVLFLYISSTGLACFLHTSKFLYTDINYRAPCYSLINS